MMTCKELTELVTDYLEGRMPFVERLSFRLHVAVCAPCRVYLEQLEETVALLGKLPDDFEVPAEMRCKLQALFRDWKVGRVCSKKK